MVISAAHNDPSDLALFHLPEEKEKSIRKSFRKADELPKILIVTEKLLTGFDAPILYCLYLDKPMRDHVLLQAIARVNRPYEDRDGRRKPAGFILDFVGIFEKLEDALAFDSDEVSGVVEGIDVLMRRFGDLLEEGRESYLPIWAGLRGDKATEAVLEHFREAEKREEFYEYFKELEELYEILSPNPFLRPYLEDYDQLVRVYQVLRATYEPNARTDRGLLRKTAHLVQEHTHTDEIGVPEIEHDLTPEVLTSLASQDKPDTVKVFNLLMAIRKIVEEKSAQTPYLLSIGERAEAVAEAFEERLSSTQEALIELTKLIQEYDEIQKRREQSDLPDEAFATLIFLESNEVKGAQKVARGSSKVFEEHRHWRESQDQEREVKTALYKTLKGSVETKKMVELVNGLLTMLKRTSV